MPMIGGKILVAVFSLAVLSGCSGRYSKPRKFSVDAVILYYRPATGQPRPRSVFLSGSFNDWQIANPEFKMVWEAQRSRFEIELSLHPGTYRYKFVVDGEWVVDPAARKTVDDPLGGKMGVFTVVDKQAVSLTNE